MNNELDYINNLKIAGGIRMKIEKTSTFNISAKRIARNGTCLILILFCICIFTACGKSSSTRTPTIRPEDIPDELYFSYTDRTIIKQERIEEGVRYIENEERMVEEAVKEIRVKLRERHEFYMSKELASDFEEYSDSACERLFNEGYYISTVAVTSYNNNINMLNDSFTLYIFNKNTELTAYAYVSDLNARKLDVTVDSLNNSDHIYAAQKAPDTEFIWFTVMGAHIEGEMQYKRLLGEDNKIYEYNQYMERGILRTDKCTAEGDAFHALPEEMRFSYNKLTDEKNMIWVSPEGQSASAG